jgi:purine-binding chemotaxis protein CheW
VSQRYAFLSFRVGQQWFGIDVESVFEVLPMLVLSDLPGAAPEILGLMTVRDMVMPVIDLRVRFGVDALIRMDTVIIALTLSSGTVGLVVDDVDRVETVQQNEISLHETNLSPYISGVVRRDTSILYLLNTEIISQFHMELAGKES